MHQTLQTLYDSVRIVIMNVLAMILIKATLPLGFMVHVLRIVAEKLVATSDGIIDDNWELRQARKRARFQKATFDRDNLSP